MYIVDTFYTVCITLLLGLEYDKATIYYKTMYYNNLIAISIVFCRS